MTAEHQQIESLSAEATPLVQLLRSQGGRSEVLTRWHNIAQDVAAFQAKKPGNPIQTLETFISTDLDKITPETNCKAPGINSSSDVFLSVRANLSSIAVNHCYSVAISRFNEIASDFNQHLAGHFPFSQLSDTRPGYEAAPADIAEFYQTVDRDSPGLATVLPVSAQNPNDMVAFLQAIATARPLVSGAAKNPNPALGISVVFRANRDREVFGNRIAQWTLGVGQQTLNFPPDPGDIPPLIWQFGDPVTLALRYANNSPEAPSARIHPCGPNPGKDGDLPISGRVVAIRPLQRPPSGSRPLARPVHHHDSKYLRDLDWERQRRRIQLSIFKLTCCRSGPKRAERRCRFRLSLLRRQRRPSKPLLETDHGATPGSSIDRP